MVTTDPLACIETSVEALKTYCTDHRIWVVVAESCTGGLVAAACTHLAGASNWFDRGYICYNNRAKREQLGVPTSTLAAYGAVSPQVARAMAVKALERSCAHVALAVTGYAGPASELDKHEVGTVFFGYASAHQPEGVVLHARLSGGREAVRDQAVAHGLRFLFEQIQADQVKQAQ